MATKRILYLHGLQSGPSSRKKDTLVELYGEANVKGPNLKTRQTLVLAVLFLILLAVIMAGAVAVCFVYLPIWAGIITIPCFVLIFWLVVSLGGRGVSAAMVKRAAKIADETFADFRPNVIVASSFGAVIAVNMESPKLPMLLFTPAQAAYARYMKSREQPSISAYPYVIIVHPSHDKVVSLDDSIQLVETSQLGRTRLEVLEDDHKLNALTKDDIRDFVDEVYERGRTEVLSRSSDPAYDPSLFADGPAAATGTGTGTAAPAAAPTAAPQKPPAAAAESSSSSSDEEDEEDSNAPLVEKV